MKQIRKCPECGRMVPAAFLLCECGYHFQTKRRLDPSSADKAPTSAKAEPEDELEIPPRIWLHRASVTCTVLAYLGAIASAICIVILVSSLLVDKHVVAEAGNDLSKAQGHGAGADLSMPVTVAVVAIGALVHFILMMGAGEALAAVRLSERHVIALRRSARP